MFNADEWQQLQRQQQQQQLQRQQQQQQEVQRQQQQIHQWQHDLKQWRSFTDNVLIIDRPPTIDPNRYVCPGIKRSNHPLALSIISEAQTSINGCPVYEHASTVLSHFTSHGYKISCQGKSALNNTVYDTWTLVKD